MRTDEAIEIVREHAATCGVPWGRVVHVRKRRAWWFIRVLGYEVEVDTGRGPFRAIVPTSWASISHCDFEPTDPNDFLIPPWLTCPFFINSVSIYWKMGHGEHYLYRRWLPWFRALSPERQAEYRWRFPVSAREGWDWFWEAVGLRERSDHPS
jgi:hypothetical protein